MNNANKVDFYIVYTTENTDPRAKFDYEIKVDFTYKRIQDLVVKGGEFVGFWNGEKWSLHIDDLIDAVDNDIHKQKIDIQTKHPDAKIKVSYMNFESSGIMLKFFNYCKKRPTSDIQFDEHILFSNDVVKREDYSTYQLPYTPLNGPTPSFDSLTDVLYERDELDKIMWCIGALFSGDMPKIQKFLYLYGAKGTGKGTMLNIIRQLIGNYIAPIDLQVLTGPSEFATGVIKEAPVLLDADSDISKIQKEMNLLKLTAHEEVIVRKLHRQGYPYIFKGLLITASNERYKVKNVDSGITRRALVAHPTGKLVPMKEYIQLERQIAFEIPYIAQKCIDRYHELGISYYQDDVDVDMMVYSDKIFDFVREHEFELENGISLKRVADLYKLFLEDMGFDTRGYKKDIKVGLTRYFDTFIPDGVDEDGNRIRNYYKGFKIKVAFPERTKSINKIATNENQDIIHLDKEAERMLDIEGKDWQAQYAGPTGLPTAKWEEVTTTLKDLDPTKLHFVRAPENHIFLDFDIKDENGDKNLEMNMAKASLYPKTYTEVSKSGQGLHLHYWYDGDISMLANEIEPGIEIKMCAGKSSIRRKYIESNGLPIAHISSGLPQKDLEPYMYKDIEDFIWTERKLRNFVKNCIAKKHHGATAPEVSYILDTLTKAKDDGIDFDLSDLRDDVYRFAMHSSNQYNKCMEMFSEIPFTTIVKPEEKVWGKNDIIPDEELYFYDIEVFSNLLLVCWKKNGLEIPRTIFDNLVYNNNSYKFIGNPSEQKAYEQWCEENKDNYGIWFNPTPEQMEWLFNKPLVGFNNRKYDNHIIYNRYMSASIEQLYKQSQDIINNNSGTIAGAYNISYADLYEFHDKKQSLKQFQIEYGITHDESEFPWDKPLEEKNFMRVAQYCMNDVVATEYVFNHPDGQAAYTARKILCGLTDLPVNTKTQTLAEKFLFGDDPRPQDSFNWYDLSEEFPGYTFDAFRKPKSDYLGKDPSEGGYVSAKPGVYGLLNSESRYIIEGVTRKKDIIYIDVESLHPHSLIAMNYFGKYTPKFKALVQCRMYIKHGMLDKAAHAFDDVDISISEKIQPYLQDMKLAKGLGHAMKIVINIVYGMTSAGYDNKFKDPRNIDNCVAKRGALFMILAEKLLTERGCNVVHVKTDSMKITDYTDADIEFVYDLANQYGYKFALECVFDKMALVNDAVLIGHEYKDYEMNPTDKWEAVGAQFANPIVFKKLFSKEPILEEDFAILKSTKQAPIYLGSKFIGKNAEIYASKSGYDCNRADENDISPKIQARMLKPIEKLLPKRDYMEKVGKDWYPLPNHIVQENIYAKIAKEVDVDIKLVKDIVNAGYPPYVVENMNSVTGTKGYKWNLWSDYKGFDDVDLSYYNQLVIDAVEKIYSVGDGDLLFESSEYGKYVKDITIKNNVSQKLQGL